MKVYKGMVVETVSWTLKGLVLGKGIRRTVQDATSFSKGWKRMGDVLALLIKAT